MAIFRVIFHARTDAAPHAFVDGGVDAVALGTKGGEIDVAARLGVLGGEDVVPGGVFIEIGILRLVRLVEKHLGELQHVVGVARLGTIEVVDVVLCIGGGEEVLAHAVSADADGAVLRHVLPEVVGGSLIGGAGVFLIDALEAYVFGHLGVGVLSVEEGGVECLHAAHHGLVAVFLGGIEVFAFAKQTVGVGERLVHTAVLPTENFLHLTVREVADHENTPVAHVLEERLGKLGVGVEPGITQSCQHLVLAIEGNPAAVGLKRREVAAVETRPDLVEWLSADESFQSFGVVVEGALAIVENVQHVVEALLHLCLRVGIAGGGVCQRQGGEIVTAHMSFERP